MCVNILQQYLLDFNVTLYTVFFLKVGASFHLTNVTVYVVDTKKVQPFGGPTPEIPTSPFSPGQSIRKSFSKERPVNLRTKTKINVKTIEESTSGTDPEEDISGDITNIKDYTEVFQPNRARKSF